MPAPKKVAVVGVGYFGSFHCQKLLSLPGVQLSAVVDIDRLQAGAMADRCQAEALTSHRELAGQVDAAIVAVPTSAHHQVAADLLKNGISVLVEKPLATTVADADHLCQLVEGSDLLLQVGHLERFNSAFLEASRMVDGAKIIHMERSGPFPGRGGDVDVVLELMSHDLDILLQLTNAAVQSVSASGQSVMTTHLDQVTARIEFSDGLVANLLASRIGTQRTRRFSVQDRQGLLEVDLAARRITRTDTAQAEAEKFELESEDSLLDQDRAFVEALHNGRKPRVDAQAGRAAVELASRILECAHSGRAS